MLNPEISVTVLAPGCPRLPPEFAIQWSDTEVEPWQARYVELLGQSQWSGTCLPSAALIKESVAATSGDGTDLSEYQHWVCADPIHLKVDRDTATIVPPELLTLRESEADALLASINQFLLDDGFHAFRSSAERWFIAGKDASALRSYPTSFLAMRKATGFLPEGVGARSWTQLMSELQMLLHSHEVNQEREQAGLLPVNSVWAWGGAPLGPCRAIPAKNLEVFTNDPFASSLARLLDINCRPLSAYDPMSEVQTVLIVDTRFEQALLARDESLIKSLTLFMQEQWLKPVQARLMSGAPMQWEVYNENGERGCLNSDSMSHYQATIREANRPMAALGQVAHQLSAQTKTTLVGMWQRLFEKQP